MEQHRTHGFLNFNVEPIELFARQCSLTGEGMNKGFCILDGDMYIKHEKDMVRHLRENFAQIIEDSSDFDSDDFDMDPETMTDAQILDACFEVEYYCYTEWTAEDADEDYIKLQKAAHMLLLNDFDISIDGLKIALTAWNNRLDMTTEVYLQDSDVEEWAFQYDEILKDSQS